MAESIPDLWSDDIQVKVLTPASILRAQVPLLRRKTQGLLEAVVDTRTSEQSVRHHFDLIAPAVNGYRERILTATHLPGRVYPVTVTAECFAAKEKSRWSALLLPTTLSESPPNERTATTQETFIGLVKDVLRSSEVRGAIESLIAQSNEATTSPPALPDSVGAAEVGAGANAEEEKPPG